MIIEINGLFTTESIDEWASLDFDWLAFDFQTGSPFYVKQVSSGAGIIPDYRNLAAAKGEKHSEECQLKARKALKTVGVFADDMPQNIIIRLVNFKLDVVRLEGNESAVMVENLLRSVVPDLCQNLEIVKTIHVSTAPDTFDQCKEYEGLVDYFLFRGEGISSSLLDGYTGTTPFLLGNDVEEDVLAVLKANKHPKFAGVSIEKSLSADQMSDTDSALKERIIRLREL